MSEGATARFYAILVVILAATGFGYAVGRTSGAAAGHQKMEQELERLAVIASRQEIRIATISGADSEAESERRTVAASVRKKN